MWKNIATNPPPENVAVWVTNGKACCLATLIKVKKGKKTELQWQYGTYLMHDAERWCSKEEFEALLK